MSDTHDIYPWTGPPITVRKGVTATRNTLRAFLPTGEVTTPVGFVIGLTSALGWSVGLSAVLFYQTEKLWFVFVCVCPDPRSMNCLEQRKERGPGWVGSALQAALKKPPWANLITVKYSILNYHFRKSKAAKAEKPHSMAGEADPRRRRHIATVNGWKELSGSSLHHLQLQHQCAAATLCMDRWAIC